MITALIAALSSLSLVLSQIHTVLAQMLPPLSPIEELIKLKSEAYGLDFEKNRRIVMCESDFFPGAKNPLSSAKGLAQIISGTWEAFGCEGDPLNENDNLECMMKIATTSGYQHWASSSKCSGVVE